MNTTDTASTAIIKTGAHKGCGGTLVISRGTTDGRRGQVAFCAGCGHYEFRAYPMLHAVCGTELIELADEFETVSYCITCNISGLAVTDGSGS